MHRLGLFGFTALIVVSIATYGAGAQNQPSSVASGTQAGPTSGIDKKSISKELADEALKLKGETESRLKKLDQLENVLKDNQRNTEFAGKTVDDLLALLRDSATRLAADGVFRKLLGAQEGTARDLANQSATHPDPKIREMSRQFNDRADEIAAMGREAEQLRAGLLAQIGRLAEQKERLRFSVALSEIEEFVKNSRAYLDQLNDVARGSKSLADKLDDAFGSDRPSQ
jgi:hypothetical protein